MPSRAQTIRRFAREYFVRVNYVDIYGHNVGYDYEFILAEIKKQFPKARTSKRWLRMMAYEITGTVRMPMRRRSRTLLAKGYSMSLLIETPARSFRSMQGCISRKFPEHVPTVASLKRLERSLRALKFTVPPRPA